MIPSIIVMILMSTFWTFNNFAYVWLATGAGPGTFTNVMATEVYLKAFVDGRMGYSSALGIVMASIMTVFGIIYLRMIVKRNLKEMSPGASKLISYSSSIKSIMKSEGNGSKKLQTHSLQISYYFQ